MFIDMRNSGKSTATIEELSLSITHELPPEPQYYEAQKIAFAPIVAGGTSRRTLRFITEWPQETIDKVISGSLKFYMSHSLLGRFQLRNFRSQRNGVLL